MKQTAINDTFIKSCQDRALVRKGDTVLIGLSGGPDSVCLTHLLYQNQDKLGIKLHLAHLNHQLRPEANREEDWVRKLAASLGLPLTVKKVKVKELAASRKMSLEEAARQARYEFFDRLAAKIQADKIALAHTADDQAETVLLWLIRGAGSGGLRGIPWQRGKIIRPLLGTNKSEILADLKKHKLSYCQDQSNLKLDFTRNKIRQQLLPYLAKLNPRIKENLWRTAEILAEEDLLLEELTGQAKLRIGRNLAKLTALSPALQRRILRQSIGRKKGDLKDISFGHVEKIRQMLGRPNWQLDLPGLTALSQGSRLDFARGRRPGGSKTFSGSKKTWPLNVPGQIRLPRSGDRITARLVRSAQIPWKKLRQLAPKTVYLALHDKTDLKNLAVRFRRPGDRFFPLGSPGRRKLQDFLVDRGIPRHQRDTLPLLLIGPKIAWVIGREIGQEFRVGPQTKLALKLTWQRA